MRSLKRREGLRARRNLYVQRPVRILCPLAFWWSVWAPVVPGFPPHLLLRSLATRRAAAPLIVTTNLFPLPFGGGGLGGGVYGITISVPKK